MIAPLMSTYTPVRIQLFVSIDLFYLRAHVRCSFLIFNQLSYYIFHCNNLDVLEETVFIK